MANPRKRKGLSKGPIGIAASEGSLTWVDPDRDTQDGRTAARQHQRGLVSRDRLLTEARRLFAQHGFDATTVRDITFAAGVNIGAVNHHFGTKEALYHEILAGLIGPLVRRIEYIAQVDGPALGKIEQMVRDFFHHNRVHPEMVPLIVREMASDHDLAPPLRLMVGRAIPTLAALIAQGQQDGTICPGDTTLLALSSLAQPVYLNLARKGIAAGAGLDPNDPAVFDRVVDHCVTVLKAALEKRP